MSSDRFDLYLEQRNRQRRNEARAIAGGLGLMAVVCWVASNWHTIILVVALFLSALIHE